MSSKIKNTTTSIDSVDQIRNILFGEQIAMIEKRFSDLEKSLTDTISKLSDRVDKSNNQLQSDAASMDKQQAELIKSLDTTIHNKIIETESDLLNQIQAGLSKLDKKASHRNDLAKLLKEMASRLSD